MELNRYGMFTISREKLYQKVWTTPILHVAKEFGISDVGLAKICRRYKIPRPPVGYWAKLQNGKKVKRKRLPVLDDPSFQEVSIRPSKDDDFDIIKPEIRQAIESESLTQNVIVVPDNLVDPLPIIIKTTKSLKAAKANEWGRVQPSSKSALYVSVTPHSIKRAMRILDSMIKALKVRSFSVSSDGVREIKVEVYGEEIKFVITEEVNRIKLDQLVEKKPGMDSDQCSYRYRDYIYIPSGRLILEIITYGREGIRRRWRDGKKQKIEGVLNLFVVSLLKLADSIYQRRVKEEEERKRREEWERQRAEKLRQIHEEEERIKQLTAEVDAWHYSNRMRVYIDAVREAATTTQGQIEDDSACAKWLAWATRQSDRADPLVESPESILDEKPKWER